MVGPVGYDDFAGFTHAFLIREPGADDRLLSAQARGAPRSRISGSSGRPSSSSARPTGSGHAPPVIDAADVLADPAGVLSKLCAALGIAWDPAMLRWPPGRRATDGPWAPHWYAGGRGQHRLRPARDRAGRPARRGAPRSPSAAGLITSGWRRTKSPLEVDATSSATSVGMNSRLDIAKSCGRTGLTSRAALLRGAGAGRAVAHLQRPAALRAGRARADRPDRRPEARRPDLSQIGRLTSRGRSTWRS